ncbi:MAG: type II toxin-antitoxin system MqsA family antitoxin [Chromatiaceae bacterium]
MLPCRARRRAPPIPISSIPSFIAGVRKKLHLGQREAAELFGGGVNAFSRYENGKTKPPLALVRLLTPPAFPVSFA